MCDERHVWKLVEVVWSVDLEPRASVDMLAYWSCVRLCVSPLCWSCRAYDRVKRHWTLVCAETLVILHGLWGRALKIDRVLFKLITKLKANSPESQVWSTNVVRCCMSPLVRDDEGVLWHVRSYEPYSSCIDYSFDANQVGCTWCLAGVEHL
jgi:hypothetical protein